MDNRPECPEACRPYSNGLDYCKLHDNSLCLHEYGSKCTEYDRWLEEETTNNA